MYTTLIFSKIFMNNFQKFCIIKQTPGSGRRPFLTGHLLHDHLWNSLYRNPKRLYMFNSVPSIPNHFGNMTNIGKPKAPWRNFKKEVHKNVLSRY